MKYFPFYQKFELSLLKPLNDDSSNYDSELFTVYLINNITMILKLMILPKQKYMRILNIAFQNILKIFMELLILYYLLKIQKVIILLLIFWDWIQIMK